MMRRWLLGCATLCCWFCVASVHGQSAESPATDSHPQRLLYVAVPGVRDYLEYGGHGLLVFDIDHDHRCLKRIKTGGLDETGKPINVKGICACAKTGRVYISTLKTLMCVDIKDEKVVWERSYEGGCDRMAMAPDGSVIYLPTLESAHWHVIDPATGEVIAKVTPDSGSHNTVFGADGRFVYLAGLRSPLLTVADAKTHKIARQIGPFSASIRPFTIDGRQTRCYVCLNELLGFEIGALTTGEKIARVEVPGFKPGPVKRHGCPSHGIALTPDETEVWVVDAHNMKLHLFDNKQLPPVYMQSIALRDEPGWITFTRDGQFAYPSTGEIIDTKNRTIIGQLTDETGAAVQSEKMIEIQFTDGQPVAVGDQFGVGRRTN